MDQKSINKSIRNATKAGDINLVKKLIGDDIETLNTMTAFGTWLHVAAKKGHFQIVEYLVEKGIDISIKYTGENIKNMNAYEYAREFGQTEIAEYLKQKMNEKEET
ncbi:ankyrin repeat domain-containing protein [Priestia megaterium]|uniref:ankyrin repeat domain-containing protein n=1 Tax=Priestia megaterium TaxID=1404 RepID=UPI0036DE4F08